MNRTRRNSVKNKKNHPVRIISYRVVHPLYTRVILWRALKTHTRAFGWILISSVVYDVHALCTRPCAGQKARLRFDAFLPSVEFKNNNNNSRATSSQKTRRKKIKNKNNDNNEKKKAPIQKRVLYPHSIERTIRRSAAEIAWWKRHRARSQTSPRQIFIRKTTGRRFKENITINTTTVVVMCFFYARRRRTIPCAYG